ncbi:hypothetical protein [Calditerrivibrio sp.]|uniref:hypothetical protein n=1 Tax=Calditerrivibrio sp. TaxID=2792612 RepID=UPI003D115FB6
MIYGFDKYIKYFDGIIKNRRFANGYIFYGAEGIGKKLFAKEVARVALCKKGSFFNENCGCESCILVKANSHPDLNIYSNEGESSFGIDEIREISEGSYISSFMGGYKFFILDNFHLLKKEACNAFLKTLEEPGENTVFFLITSQLDRIIPTIKSRCIHLRFNRLGNDDIVKILKELGYNDEVIGNVLDISDGSVLFALKHIKYLFPDEYGRDKKGKLKGINDNFNWDDIMEHAYNLLKMIEKDDLRYYILFLLGRVIEIYKQRKEYKYLILFDNLMEIYRMLDYNVNLRILRGYILTKIYGVIGEKI